MSDNSKCKKCGEKYTCNLFKWCNPCQIDDFKKNFASGNEKIDAFIQENRLIVYDPPYTCSLIADILEWLPYNQFNDIKEFGIVGSATLYSAIWKDGPFCFNENEKVFKRYQSEKVILKRLHNSQDNLDEFLNEAKSYIEQIEQIYGISQDPVTKNYICVLKDIYCKKCCKQYTSVCSKWCKPCQIENFKRNIASGNEKIDNLIHEMQLKIDSPYDIIFEWIPYNQFNDFKEIGKGGFSTVYSAIWMDGPLIYKNNLYEREYNRKFALKCLHNSQDVTDGFLNEIKSYSIKSAQNILQIFGISQNPDTKDYILVTNYADGGDFYHWLNKNYNRYNWKSKLRFLLKIINGLKNIHQKQKIHRDLHVGNILTIDNSLSIVDSISISDMGLCGEADNIDDTKIYGVMPYVAPEVLKGKPYTQAADIYGFGMIMYFVATGKQPFATRAHDDILALDICNGIRPEINEQEAPFKCYIDLMKKCWDLNPDNRPTVIDLHGVICPIRHTYSKQFEEADKYREEKFSSNKNNQLHIHPEAYYSSRILNPFTKNLPKYDNIDKSMLEITDFMELSIKNENNQSGE